MLLVAAPTNGGDPIGSCSGVIFVGRARLNLILVHPVDIELFVRAGFSFVLREPNNPDTKLAPHAAVAKVLSLNDSAAAVVIGSLPNLVKECT